MIFLLADAIDGNATAKGYEKHIRVDAFQFGVSRMVTMEPGNLANREASRPSLSEISFTHKTDNSATALFKDAVTGAAGKTFVFKFVQTGSDSLVEYMNYTLTDCIISGYSISADGDGDPMESIQLSYAKIEVSYHDYDKTNKGASKQVVFYDLTTGTPG